MNSVDWRRFLPEKLPETSSWERVLPENCPNQQFTMEREKRYSSTLSDEGPHTVLSLAWLILGSNLGDGDTISIRSAEADLTKGLLSRTNVNEKPGGARVQLP